MSEEKTCENKKNFLTTAVRCGKLEKFRAAAAGAERRRRKPGETLGNRKTVAGTQRKGLKKVLDKANWLW